MLKTEADRYIELLIEFPPRPIQTWAQYLEFQAKIDRIIDSQGISPERQEYLNLLGTLIREYEEKHVSIPDLSGVELLKTLIAEFEVEHQDLVSIFDNESILQEVLNGDISLTVKQIEKLSNRFKISPSIFFATN